MQGKKRPILKRSQDCGCRYRSTGHQLRGNRGRLTSKVAVHANPQTRACSLTIVFCLKTFL